MKLPSFSSDFDNYFLKFKKYLSKTNATIQQEMVIKELKPRKALNKAFLKVKPNRPEIEAFKENLIQLLDRTNDTESEEFHKNLVIDFLKKTYYEPNHFINTKGKNDLVIHNGKTAKTSVGVIIEAKKPTNKAEMITTKKLNVKAFQELVLYYLRERITHKNLEVKYLIATNINEWFIFDATIFDRLFAQNKSFVKQFTDFEGGRLADIKTDFFYKQIAEPFIANLETEIEFTYFNLQDYQNPLRNADKKDDHQLIALFKLLSAEHLLKLPFTNDSNSLDKRFYTELLHIIGLTETKEGSKKLIQRNKEGERNSGSILEDAIIQLDSLDKISRLEKPSQFGKTQEERLFNGGLELSITWINRILFLKLLEAQLITYHKGDKSYSFLNFEKIKNYDDLNSLFFQVLARKQNERNEDVKKAFEKVPYLNSSLFEPTEIEQLTLFISNLKDDKSIPVHSSTVLKNDQGKKRTGNLTTLAYLFDFLNAYDFASEGSEEIQEDNKSLINASVLGLIFEKINGYKDGSFFTPGFITMYMCRETIRKSVVQKFNETKNWICSTIEEIYDKIEDRQEANTIVNSLKICDPAVGSGHFLVSSLNEMIAVKSDLRILQDRDGKRLKEYHVEVVNDELIVTDEEGELFEYKPTNKESQRIQETLFHEKQTIIENCLFGVDINPNSVKICRLRLWIELLKNAYYKNPTELETLPNIDINIKCGNSLVSRFAIDADLKEALKKSKWNINSYRIAVDTYRNAESKEQKREMEKLISAIKSDFRSEISLNDPKKKKLSKLSGELFLMTNQTQLFELGKKEKAVWTKKVNDLTAESKKLESEIEEIKANKIFENAFEWRFEFPEVLNDEGDFVGFDVVIGNPPYVAVSAISPEEREYLFSNFANASSRIDLFGIFIEYGTSILKIKGILSFIIPMQFLKNTAFKKIRENLLKNTVLEKINYVGSQIFEDANNDTIVIEYKNVKPDLNDQIEMTISKSDESDLVKESQFFTKQNFFIKDDFAISLSSTVEIDICRKLEMKSSKTFKEHFNIIQGIVTGLNEAYIFDTNLPQEIENQNINSFLLGSDFKEYSINSTATKQILYLDKKTQIDIIPNSLKWLSHFKEKLDKRREVVNGSIPWYSLQWPRDEKLFNQPKIIFQKIRNQRLRKRLVGTLDLGKHFLGDGVIFLTSKIDNIDALKYALALLNSELYNFYYRQNFLDVNLKIMFLEKTPFIDIDQKQQIIFLVNKILEIKTVNQTSDTSHLQNQIDSLIYKSLSITEEEIAIVENSSK